MSLRSDQTHTFEDSALSADGRFSGKPRVHLTDEEREAMRRQAAASRADEVAIVRDRLATSSDGRVHQAAELALRHLNARMPEADYKAFVAHATSAVRSRKIEEDLGALEAGYRSRVAREPGPYEDDSPHSWVLDTLAMAGATGSAILERTSGGYAERLARHGQDVARALQDGSDYGRWIERSYVQRFRQDDAHENEQRAKQALKELRALGSGGGATASASGGGAAAFVPPAILVDEWVQYRSPYAAFVGQLDDSIPLPPYGLTVYVPAWTTGTTVGTQTEGSAVAEGDPVSAYLSAAVVEKAGLVTVSQLFIDRAGPGISADRVLVRQLSNQLAAQVDGYALGQALANAQTVTNTGTFALTTASGVGGFLGDLKHAKSKLTDTAGVRLRGTHAFATGDLVDYVSSYADAQGRPVFTPSFDDNRLPIKSVGDGAPAQGYSGYVLGGLALFADDSIPESGSNTQVVVCRADTILHLESAPVFSLFPQGAAGNLESQAIARQYVATIPRWPSGVASISGAAYAASTFA